MWDLLVLDLSEIYNKHLKHNIGRPGQGSFFLKGSEFTFVDKVAGVVFKRIFEKTNLHISNSVREEFDLPRILEEKKHENYTDYLIEYVDGLELTQALQLFPKESAELLTLFDDYLAKWLHLSTEATCIKTYSLDIQPGNFIVSSDRNSVCKIDFLIDWELVERPIYYYCYPFIRLIEMKLVTADAVETIFSRRRQILDWENFQFFKMKSELLSDRKTNDDFSI